jgi:hypothetical protein
MARLDPYFFEPELDPGSFTAFDAPDGAALGFSAFGFFASRLLLC